MMMDNVVSMEDMDIAACSKEVSTVLQKYGCVIIPGVVMTGGDVVRISIRWDIVKIPKEVVNGG